MRIVKIFSVGVALVFFASGYSSGAQEMSGMEQAHSQHEHMAIQPLVPTYPGLGRTLQQNPLQEVFTLQEALRIAAVSNPTLRQAQAQTRAVQALQQQAGLYPNPTVGYIGDEIRGGSVGGGKQGFFVQQSIVTGRKLTKAQQVRFKEHEIAAIEISEQELRVRNSVKIAYYRVLAAQELLDAYRQLAGIEQDYAETQRQLFNTGQVDQSELLQAEIAAQRRRLTARLLENTLREEWRSLAATIGRADLPQQTAAGPLDQNLPEINEAEIAQHIATQGPAARIAASSNDRAEAALGLAKRAASPNLNIRAGLFQNNNPLSNTPNAIGWEGLAEVGVEVPVFNRNQGNIAAATAEVDRAKLEAERVHLVLQQRAASVLDEYSNARIAAATYHEEILPRARQAYDLLLQKYGQMLASYPRVLDAQRTLFQLHVEYVSALQTVWTSGTALQGFLLTDGLEAPATPGAMDWPVREVNLPVPETTLPWLGGMPRP